MNKTFCVATWNVNSIRVRLEQLITWLAAHQPDLLALQETKVVDNLFPQQALQEAGYHVVYHGEKSYNGVAVLSRRPVKILSQTVGLTDDHQARCLTVQDQDFTMVNVYVPNGQSLDSAKYSYKLAWLNALTQHLRDLLADHKKLCVVGDFNIAPTDQDVYDPQIWQDRVLVSPPERQALQKLLDLGLVDLYRSQYPDMAGFSWWNYRQGAFRRDRGLRIDLILATENLRTNCQRLWVDRDTRGLPRPSDHAPVVANFIC